MNDYTYGYKVGVNIISSATSSSYTEIKTIVTNIKNSYFDYLWDQKDTTETITKRFNEFEKGIDKAIKSLN